MQRERVQDEYPWTWEIPLAVVCGALVVAGAVCQLSRSLANWFAGDGWLWPPPDKLVTSLPALLAGDAAAGLSGVQHPASAAALWGWLTVVGGCAVWRRSPKHTNSSAKSAYGRCGTWSDRTCTSQPGRPTDDRRSSRRATPDHPGEALRPLPGGLAHRRGIPAKVGGVVVPLGYPSSAVGGHSGGSERALMLVNAIQQSRNG